MHSFSGPGIVGDDQAVCPPVIETWHLEEVWRLDNEENEDLPLMGAITQGAVTGAANLWVEMRPICGIIGPSMRQGNGFARPDTAPGYEV